MSCSRSLFLPGMVLAVYVATVPAWAQGPSYGWGRNPTAEEIRAWDKVGVEGKELPRGSGTAKQGAPIYAQKCALCHGPKGEGVRGGGSGTGEGQAQIIGGPRLVGRTGTLEALRWWPFATGIWNMISSAMPLYEGGSLRADEVYALTALMLYWNHIVEEDHVLDGQSLPKVQMPNRDGFVPSPWPEPELEKFRARCPKGICP